MARRMPNASMAQDNWGGINAPRPTIAKRTGPDGRALPPLKQYPVEQVLYFHEMHLRDIMTAVGKLQYDASKNAQSPTETGSVDVEAIKKSVKAELSEQFSAQNRKIEKQQKTIASLRQEIVDLRKNLEDNVELVVEEA